MLFRSLREDSKKSIWEIADEVLRSNKDIQKKLGFSTIFKKELPTVLDIQLRDNKINRNISSTTGKSLKRICGDIFSNGNEELICQFISRFENGAQIAELQQEYSNISERTVSRNAKEELEVLLTSLFKE